MDPPLPSVPFPMSVSVVFIAQVKGERTAIVPELPPPVPDAVASMVTLFEAKNPCKVDGSILAVDPLKTRLLVPE